MTSPGGGGDTVAKVDIALGIDATGARQEAQREANAIEQSLDDITVDVQAELTGGPEVIAAVEALARAASRDIPLGIDVDALDSGLAVAAAQIAEAIDNIHASLPDFGPTFDDGKIKSFSDGLSATAGGLILVEQAARRTRSTLDQFYRDIASGAKSLEGSFAPLSREVEEFARNLRIAPSGEVIARDFDELTDNISDRVTSLFAKVSAEVDREAAAMSQPMGASISRTILDAWDSASSDLDFTEFARRMSKEINDKVAKTSINVPSFNFGQAAKDLAREIGNISPEIHTRLNVSSLLAASARLAALARARIVPLVPVVNNAAVRVAGAQFGTLLARLSGARVVSNSIEDMVKAFRRLDLVLPAISLLTTGIIGLIGYLGTAVSNVFALGASLAQIGPIALALPAAFAAVGISIGVFVAAFKDFNTIFPAVSGQLAALQDRISGNFWAQATAGVQAFLDAPWQDFQAGIATTATALGAFTGKLAQDLAAGLDVGPMFASLNQAIGVLGGATGPITNILNLLGQAGSAILPLVAEKFVGLTETFSNFLSEKGVGGLTSMFETAITQIGELFRALGGLGNIFAGIANAATAAGGSTLTMFADTLDRVAAVVNSPVFQFTLINFFAAAHEAMTNIATIAGPAVEGMFLALAQTLGAVLPMVGTTIGTLLEAIATGLADPQLRQGFIQLVAGISSGLTAIAPAIGPVAAAFGELGAFIGALAANLGPVLGTVFTVLAESLHGILPALQPLISILGGALISVVQALAPVIEQLALAFASILAGGIIPLITGALGALVPVITQLAPLIGGVLLAAMMALAPIFTTLTPVITQLATTLGAILVPIITALTPILELVASVLARVMAAVAPLITVVLDLIDAVLVPLLPVILDVINLALIPLMLAFEIILPIITALGTLLQWVVDSIITPILMPAIKFLADFLHGILGPAIDAIGATFAAVWDFVKGVWDSFSKLFQGDIAGFIAGIQGAFSGFSEKMKEIWNTLWSKVGELLLNAWNSFIGTVNEKGAEILAYFASLPGRVREKFGDALEMLRSIGRNIVQGLINGISSMAGALAGFVSDFITRNIPSVVRDILGISSPSTVGADIGGFFIEGIIEGMEGQYSAVKRSLKGLTTTMTGLDFRVPVTADVGALSSMVADGTAGGWVQRVLNYYAAPGGGLSSEEDLFNAAGRGRMVW